MRDRVRLDLSWAAALNEARLFSDPLVRFLRRIRVHYILLLAACIALSCVVAAFAVSRHSDDSARAMQDSRGAQVRDWALSHRAGTEREIEEMFRLASRIRVDEAVPKAVLYAIRSDRNEDRSRRYHVLAARDFLEAYTIDEIEAIVRKTGGQFGNPEEIIGRLREVMNQ